jgi:hypothetical protein
MPFLLSGARVAGDFNIFCFVPVSKVCWQQQLFECNWPHSLCTSLPGAFWQLMLYSDAPLFLQRAGSDLIGFGVYMVIFFLAFTYFSHFAFGHVLYKFGSPTHSQFALFEVFLGQFQYAELCKRLCGAINLRWPTSNFHKSSPNSTSNGSLTQINISAP